MSLRRARLPLAFLGVAAAALLGRRGADAADGESAPAPPTSSLTIERLFGGPPIVGGGPSIASWRPRRDAWVEWRGSGEERALFEVDAESGAAKRLVALSDMTALRGKDEKPVPCRGIGRAGMPDHVFARGGDQVVVPVGGDLVWADVVDGKKRRMTKTAAPIADARVSPDGQSVAFSRDNELWVSSAPAQGDGPCVERRLTFDGGEDVLNATLDWVYPEELDVTSAIEWSPDSTRIAFLRLEEAGVPRFELGDPIPLHGAVDRERYPKAGDKNPVARVGVVAVGARDGAKDGAASPPVWLDLGVAGETYVPWFTWLPDRSRVLVAVLNRDQTHLEIRACDPTGSPSKVWWSEDDPRWVDLPPPPRFLESAPFALLRSRRDGFWRLWRVALDGSTPRPLTPPGEEIGDLLAVDERPAGSPSSPSADGAAGAAYVTREDRATLRTQVVRVPLDGSGASGKPGPVVVTDAALSHSARFSPTGRFFVDAASKAGVPTTWTLRRADGTAVRALGDARTKSWDALALRPPEIRTLAGDPEIRCLVRSPRAFDPSKRWPVVFHVYGGPGSRMVSDSFGGGGLFDELLAESGFVVVSADGRGTAGRGKDFEATVHRRLGTCEVEDLVAAVGRLAAESWFDRSRVGVWGWSYGGTFAALAMGRAPQVFRAGVAVAPVTDWRLYDTIYTERYMDLPSENEEGYRVAAPVTWAKDVTGALLLAHGLGDDNVHAQNTYRMVQALVAGGRAYDLQIYPQRGHGIEGANERRHLHRRIVEHFVTRLGAGPK